MSGYRCYFLDNSDRIAACQKLACEDDIQAQENAYRLLVGSSHAAVEIWQFDRKVYRADRG